MMEWHPAVADWVAVHIWGNVRAFEENQALGVFHGGQIIGGIVFHAWNPEAGTIEASAASADRRWLTRAVMSEAMGYAFGVAGCQMVVARMETTNTPARKIWLGLGGSEVVIPRLYGRGRDGSIITVTAEQWAVSKFNKEARHGQERQRTQAA